MATCPNRYRRVRPYMFLKSTAGNQFLFGSGVVAVDGGRIGKMIEG